MSTTVRLDENLGNRHADAVRARGYDADRATDEGQSGADDDRVRQRVAAEGLFSLLWILIFRMFEILEMLERVLQDYDLEAFAGCLVIAD
jgi:hypothetical protein